MIIKNKKLIITITSIILASIFTLALTLTLIFTLKKDKNQNNNDILNISVDAYTFPDFKSFSNSELTTIENNCIAYSEFLIDDLPSFKTFGYLTYGSDHYNFANKTVKLTANIDFNYTGKPSDTNNLIDHFAGTFDGQGYEILRYQVDDSFDSAFFGLIMAGGIVKNTKFTATRVRLGGASQGTGKCYTGVIAETVNSGGTIDSCVIDSCYFLSGRSKGDAHVGAIAGTNNGTIKNCIVMRTYCAIGEKGALGADGIFACGIDAYPFVAKGNNATNSIFASHLSWGSWVDNSKLSNGVNSTLHHYDQNSQNGNFSEYSYALGNLTNCSTRAGRITDSGFENLQWFQYTTGGYMLPLYRTKVYLRAFISFNDITFSAGDGGTISPGVVTVPVDNATSDIIDYGSITYDNVNGTAEVYGTTVTSTPNTYYKFAGWSGTQALFTRQYIEIEFKAVSVNGVTITPYKTDGSALPTLVDYKNGSEVKYNGLVNNKISYTVIYNNNEITIYYDLSNIFTTASEGITSNDTKITVEPDLRLKQYGSVWL